MKFWCRELLKILPLFTITLKRFVLHVISYNQTCAMLKSRENKKLIFS